MMIDLVGRRPARPGRDVARTARAALYAIAILGAVAWVVLVGIAVYGPYLGLDLF